MVHKLIYTGNFIATILIFDEIIDNLFRFQFLFICILSKRQCILHRYVVYITLFGLPNCIGRKCIISNN